jgi:hypothetical protein
MKKLHSFMDTYKFVQYGQSKVFVFSTGAVAEVDDAATVLSTSSTATHALGRCRFENDALERFQAAMAGLGQ